MIYALIITNHKQSYLISVPSCNAVTLLNLSPHLELRHRFSRRLYFGLGLLSFGLFSSLIIKRLLPASFVEADKGKLGMKGNRSRKAYGAGFEAESKND
jgi:hypothetical protein